MSMALCANCCEYIDTDADPDSTYFDMRCICESCREHLTQEEQKEHEDALYK